MTTHARLENWSVVSDPYKAPEIASLFLSGTVFGHTRVEDGATVTTSRIVGKRGTLIITHSGTEYELGKVDPNYERAFPKAYDRLLGSLKDDSREGK